MNEDYRILNASEKISFKKKIDAINWCTAKNYDDIAWQQACWPSNRTKNEFRIWFPKLAEKKNGNYLPTSDGFVNYLSDDWDFFYFDNLNSENRTYNPKEGYLGINILFAKDFSGDYIFRGVYRIDFEKSGPNHLVHKRIATRIKLIGNPVQRYEMLDTVETTIIDDINTPLKPKDVIRKEDGITQYICGRCTTQFIKSPRCPECGQLVKE